MGSVSKYVLDRYCAKRLRHKLHVPHKKSASSPVDKPEIHSEKRSVRVQGPLPNYACVRYDIPVLKCVFNAKIPDC